MNIYDLKVDRIKNPVGLFHKNLQFSFKVTGGEEFLILIRDEKTGDTVFSETIGRDNISAYYPSIDFLPGTVYTWQISCGNVKSEVANFETAAKLDASFITPSTDLTCPMIYKNFSCSEIKSARLYITGLGLYRAFINGERVGNLYLTPYFNDYDDYLRYQSYDVTSLLTEENKIEVLLGDGWYKGRIGIDGHGGETWGDKYLLSAKLVIEDKAGVITEIPTDESWMAENSVIMETSIYDGEHRDDTLAEQSPVSCEKVKTDYNLLPDLSSPVKEKALLKPTLYTSPKGEQILDFGQNMVGICRFRDRLNKGDKISLKFGEVLQEDCFYRDNLRSAKAEFTYVSNGEGLEVEQLFTFYGFRYALVDGVESVDPNDFTGVVLYSDLEDTLTVETDSKNLNQLLKNAYWGQRGNFLDVPTDCPQRDERLGWTADTQVFVDTACYNMDCYGFYKKYMRDMRFDQETYYEGDIPMYSPSLKKSAGNGGAVWADAGTIIPWKTYMAYGDKILLKENYTMMKEYVYTLENRDREDGGTHLIRSGFTFGDWLAQDGICEQALMGATDDVFIKSVYYYNSVDLIAKAAEVLGFTKDNEHYNQLKSDIKNAILAEFFSANGRFALDTQTSYVLALKYDLYADKDRVIDAFKERLRKDFYKMKSGFTGTPLLLPVLFENGLTEDAYRILFNEECPGWMYAINLGATTIWERWNSLLEDGTISGINMNSLNHYAYGAVSEAVYAHICGLKSTEAGWKKALIAPKPNFQVKKSDITFNSPVGDYRVSWNISKVGWFEMKVEIPYGATAEVLLPGHPEGKTELLEGGTYSYRYESVVDFWHPYNKHSKLLDLVNNSVTADILKREIPQGYAFITGENEEFLPNELISLAFIDMFGVSFEDIMRLDSILKEVEV